MQQVALIELRALERPDNALWDRDWGVEQRRMRQPASVLQAEDQTMPLQRSVVAERFDRSGMIDVIVTPGVG